MLLKYIIEILKNYVSHTNQTTMGHKATVVSFFLSLFCHFKLKALQHNNKVKELYGG